MCHLPYCLLHPSVGNCPRLRASSESLWTSFHHQITPAPLWGEAAGAFADHTRLGLGLGSASPVPKTDIRFALPLDGGFFKGFGNVLV